MRLLFLCLILSSCNSCTPREEQIAEEVVEEVAEGIIQYETGYRPDLKGPL
jgi:hypothetical protein